MGCFLLEFQIKTDLKLSCSLQTVSCGSPPAALRRWAGPLGCRCQWSRLCTSSFCSGCFPGGGWRIAGRRSWKGNDASCYRSLMRSQSATILLCKLRGSAVTQNSKGNEEMNVKITQEHFKANLTVCVWQEGSRPSPSPAAAARNHVSGPLLQRWSSPSRQKKNRRKHQHRGEFNEHIRLLKLDPQQTATF